MKVYLLFLSFWISLISFAQQNISVETIIFSNSINKSAKSNIPHVIDKSGVKNIVVNKINESIMERFMIDNFDTSKAVNFSWSDVDYKYEIKSDILLISFWGEYLGAYLNYINDNLYFDLSNGSLLVNKVLPFNALFSLQGYFSFLNKYWIPGCIQKYDEAAKCAGLEPDCNCYQIDLTYSATHLDFSLTDYCFPHYISVCNPHYSIVLLIDSIKPYFSDFGKYVIFEKKFNNLTELERFLFYRENFNKIPNYYFIVGSIDNKYPFSMALELNDSLKEANGYYFYNKHKINISLNGQFNSSQINLKESINNKTTGQFDFTWYDSYHEDGLSFGNKYLTAKWINLDSKKEMKIKLTSIKTNK